MCVYVLHSYTICLGKYLNVSVCYTVTLDGVNQVEPKKTQLDVLESINHNLEGMGQKLEKIIELQKILVERFKQAEEKTEQVLPLDVDVLLNLPDHLRKTAFAISSLGQATASKVATETGRTRAAESDYLNQLEGMGYLRRERRGRTVYFSIKK